MLIAETTLVSLGEAARQAGVSLERYAETAVALGVRAADRRDGIPWIRTEDDARICEHLKASNRPAA